MFMRLKPLKIFRLFSYSPVEIFAVITAFFFLVSAELTIRLSRPGRLLKDLSNLSLRSGASHLLLSPLKKLRQSRLVSLLEAVDRNSGWNPSCLRRACALAKLSVALGAVPEFKIGVRLQDGNLKAHSWLELDGMRLEIDGEASAYSVLSTAEANPCRS